MLTKNDSNTASTFVHYPKDSTAEITDALAKAGFGATLQLHTVDEKVYAHIVTAEGVTVAVVNDSLICPPICP